MNYSENIHRLILFFHMSVDEGYLIVLNLSIIFLKKCLCHMLVEFEYNRMVQTTEILSFLTKKKTKQNKTKTGFFLITIFDKELTPFWKTFCS